MGTSSGVTLMNTHRMLTLLRLSLAVCLLQIGLPSSASLANPLGRNSSHTISCQQVVDILMDRQQDIIEQQTKILSQRFDTLDQISWLPKAPQLRGRFDQEASIDSSQARLGLRWYLPHFFDVQDRMRNEQISPSYLVQLWNR